MKRLRRVLCFLGLGGDGILRLDKWDGAGWTHLSSDPGPYPTGGVSPGPGRGGGGPAVESPPDRKEV